MLNSTKKSDKNKTKIVFPKTKTTVLEQKTENVSTVQTSSFGEILQDENQKLKQQIDEFEKQKSLGTLAGDSTVDTSNLQPKLTAGSNIAIDSNNVISATNTTYTAGNNISISNGVISATDTTYTAGQNITIENGVISSTAGGGMTQEQSNQLATVYNYYLSQQATPDPNYNPQTFSDYPAGTILQGYAKFERMYNLTGYSTFTTPKMIFAAENNSSGSINLRLELSVSVACQTIVNIYLNNVSIFNEVKNFETASTNYVYEKTLQGITLSDANTIYVRFDPNPTSTYIYLKKQKCELIAPNAEIINELSPFFVEYIDGKYYISDCSSGKAKYAEINVENMINMSNLSWVDTGLDAYQYKTLFHTTQYGTTFLLGDKITIRNFDNMLYATNITQNITLNYTNAISADWCQENKNTTCYGIANTHDTCIRVAISKPLSMGYSSMNPAGFVNVSAAKYYNFLEKSYKNYFAVGTMANGDCYITDGVNSAVTPVLITKGTNCHCYVDVINNTNYISVFLKHYDKILKYVYRFTGTTFVLTSSEEIGAYEEYFEGANNDYFVVKNGVLEYHKKPTT